MRSLCEHGDARRDAPLRSAADGAVVQILTQAILLCAVGCIESLMTAEVVSGFTKARKAALTTPATRAMTVAPVAPVDESLSA